MSRSAACVRLCDLNRSHIYQFGLQHWFAVFEEHFDNFAQIALKFIDVGALGVGAGPTWNIAHQEARVWIALDNKFEGSHRSISKILRELYSLPPCPSSQCGLGGGTCLGSFV